MVLPLLKTDDEASLYKIQAPLSSPRSTMLASATDLLLPAAQVVDRLSHFPINIYDTSPESHLGRLLRVLLGEAGFGGVRKVGTFNRMSSTLHSSHFFDLDRFWGAVFEINRTSYERLTVNPYVDEATTEEWNQQSLRDASYKSRIEQFATAVQWGATPHGLEAVAEAMLSVDVDIYESWVEADISGESEANRHRIIVRPKRPITAEEEYNLRKVLNRIKPTSMWVTIEPDGIINHIEQPLASFHTESQMWEVTTRVVTKDYAQDIYLASADTAVEQPHTAWSGYQGEAWSYMTDVIGTMAYAEFEGGELDESKVPEEGIIDQEGTITIYRAVYALVSLERILSGRVVSGGVLTSSVYPEGVIQGQRGQRDPLGANI